MSSSIRKQPEEEEISMQGIRQMFAQFFNKMDAITERMEQRFERIDQRLAKLERSDRFRSEQPELPEEPQAFIELPVELPTLPLTLPPAEPATKPALRLSEPTILQPLPPPPPPASEPFIPKMARVAIKHHIRHRVLERIGFRSPLASCSAFVHLGHLHPAATPPLSSWTLNVVACIGQWEPSDHG